MKLSTRGSADTVKELVIGCDNAALALKKIIFEMLDDNGVPYTDVGVFDSQDATMYPDVAKKVATAIIESGYKKEGMLFCGTGIGMAIAANKFRGIYAAVCHDTFSAERARLSNDTNVLTMGARVIGPELAKRIVREWLSLEFKESSSTPKVNRIREFESVNFK